MADGLLTARNNVDAYLHMVDGLGMAQTWYSIVNSSVPVECYGELYEIGLAHVSKDCKKMLGKYYTPSDVARLMSRWLIPLPGENLCDVCCGVGNLTLAYLDELGMEKARELVLADRLWLYDVDGLAMRIALESIAKRFGNDLRNHIHLESGDFLHKDTHLPPSSKVISNPPYAKVIGKLTSGWAKSEIVDCTHELHAAMMEKILNESCSSAIITPQNHLGREKFASVRKMLSSSSHSGFIVPFDNTPGQVFNGRKHGVFNSNTQNQVRPAMMVSKVDGEHAGSWRVAGMVRFKNGERDRVLTTQCLESMVGNARQKPGSGRFRKCFPSLEGVFHKWEEASSTETFKDCIDEDGDYYLNFATTCRYFTVAYVSDLYRSGKRMVLFKDEETRDLAYCFLNSSFCYWHWRLYDGEITYQGGLLDDMPTFFSILNSDSRKRLLELAKEMRTLEPNFIVKKKNSGKMMENIRFPERYRDEIDDILLQNIGVSEDHRVFDIIHAHSVFN